MKQIGSKPGVKEGVTDEQSGEIVVNHKRKRRVKELGESEIEELVSK